MVKSCEAAHSRVLWLQNEAAAALLQALTDTNTQVSGQHAQHSGEAAQSHAVHPHNDFECLDGALAYILSLRPLKHQAASGELNTLLTAANM